jgi:hypothetical protein
LTVLAFRYRYGQLGNLQKQHSNVRSPGNLKKHFASRNPCHEILEASLNVLETVGDPATAQGA